MGRPPPHAIFPTIASGGLHRRRNRVEAPFGELAPEHQHLVLRGGGDEKQYVVEYENRFGRKRRYQTGYEGAIPWLNRRYADTDSPGAQEGLPPVHASGPLRRMPRGPSETRFR